ncbi:MULTISPECIES: molybdopterin molybdotransferase MoeA [unclassified Sphingomonas]|uniref:molybdopterin molybdotransferase MoeA n=1 Tax=unclassified Sphingomonas TaxID=196159 RepID=UPI0006F32BF1|nr:MULTISPECIES: molybdopterin molybdotransferase MoeA [unclassified Sphingomonas]KQM28384.1 molybdenum cofactor biosynthesis protein MoeA [Sphingomonas sp. Leaf9]KQM45090.1 molybdenum cofactor biosynthesis protein MoeA [Sphingomonas sp. Leaf11]
MSLLPVADAQTRVLALARPVTPETLPLTEALGRFAAADVIALRTQPARPLSAMDGYAIRFDDLPGPWEVIGESAAGAAFPGTVTAGQATRIFTGAAMPAGTDCVLVQEEATRDGTRLHLSGEGPVRGGNVRRAGLDFREGELLIAAGDRITPARAALAAIAGHGTLSVGRRARIAIAATGDELVPAGQALREDQLPESNGLMLAGLLADLPVERIDLGILPDRMDALVDAFTAVDCDLLVTTGGASVGDHDLVRPALAAAGGELDFWRIALRPGKPMLAGRLRDAAVLGLPGNPVSSFITALLFVRPLAARIAGAADPMPRSTRATLAHPLPANGARQDYLRATLIDGQVSTAAIQDSSMLRTLARSDSLIVRAPHAPAADAGDSAEILQLA